MLAQFVCACVCEHNFSVSIFFVCEHILITGCEHNLSVIKIIVRVILFIVVLSPFELRMRYIEITLPRYTEMGHYCLDP